MTNTVIDSTGWFTKRAPDPAPTCVRDGCHQPPRSRQSALCARHWRALLDAQPAEILQAIDAAIQAALDESHNAATHEGGTEMSIQDEWREAGREYARRLDEKRESERLAALTLEARREGNAAAFAATVGPLFSHGTDDTTDTGDDIEKEN